MDKNISESSFDSHILANHAKTFTALINNTLFATISVVPDSPSGLPMDDLYKEDLQFLRDNNKKIAEVTQFAVDHELLAQADVEYTPNKRFTSTLPLLSLVFHYALHFELDYLCIAISPKHDPFYKSLGFQDVGVPKYYPVVNTLSVARVLDLKALSSAGDEMPTILNKIMNEPVDYSIFKD